MAEYVFTLRNVRKAHGDKVVLDNVTLSFLHGAKIGVVGPNGTGKSTLLKIMAGLEKANNGDALLDPGATVGMLQQEPPLSEGKTVLENVEDGLALGQRRFLLQHPDGRPRIEQGVAVVRLLQAGHDLQQRRLAGAVRPDHADLGAVQERQRHVVEDHLVTVRFADIA